MPTPTVSDVRVMCNQAHYCNALNLRLGNSMMKFSKPSLDLPLCHCNVHCSMTHHLHNMHNNLNSVYDTFRIGGPNLVALKSYWTIKCRRLPGVTLGCNSRQRYTVQNTVCVVSVLLYTPVSPFTNPVFMETGVPHTPEQRKVQIVFRSIHQLKPSFRASILYRFFKTDSSLKTWHVIINIGTSPCSEHGIRIPLFPKRVVQIENHFSMQEGGWIVWILYRLVLSEALSLKQPAVSHTVRGRHFQIK